VPTKIPSVSPTTASPTTISPTTLPTTQAPSEPGATLAPTPTPTTSTPMTMLPTTDPTFAISSTINVAPSGVFSVAVDAPVIAPYSCTILPNVAGQFSTCYDDVSPHLLRVTRTDLPQGWDTSFAVLCDSASAMVNHATLAPASPEALGLTASSADEIQVTFSTNAAIGSCECAAPRLQYRAASSSSWTDAVDSSCADMASRSCTISGLLPDTRYEARMQMTCKDTALNSDFKVATSSVITRPPCIWSFSSGVSGMLECADSTRCNAANPGCCLPSHGGVVRCSPEAPVLCSNLGACGGDRCCAASTSACVSMGGPRKCLPGVDRIPAKEPSNLQVQISDPEGGHHGTGSLSLELSWTAGEHLGGASSCLFSRWEVQWAQYQNDELGEWLSLPGCEHLSNRGISACSTTAALHYHVGYLFRVLEICSVSLLNSQPSAASEYHMLVPRSTLDARVQVLGASAFGSSLHRCSTSSLPHADVPISVCHSEVGDSETHQTVSAMVTRTDDSANSGWPSPLWIACTPGAFLAGHVTVDAAHPPTSLTLSAPGINSIVAKYEISVAPVCACASFNLQVRSSSHHLWKQVGGGCTDITARQCVIEGLIPDTLYEARIRISCRDEALNSQYKYAPDPYTIGTARGESVVAGRLQIQGLSGSRRLALADAAVTGFRSAIAELANVPIRIVSAQEVVAMFDAAAGTAIVDFMIAVATVGPGVSDQDAAASANVIISRLMAPGALAGTASNFGASALIVILTEPQMQVLSQTFPRCGTPPMVGSADTHAWSPSMCAYNTWSSEACVVICSDGAPATGEYYCNVEGNWEGNPICENSWSAAPWTSCDTTCGLGAKTRDVSCSRGSGLCVGTKPATSAACEDVSACLWVTSDWSECSSACGSGLRSRTVSCPSGSPADCLSSAPAAQEPCVALTSCEWLNDEWSDCTASCGAGEQSRNVWCPAGKSCGGDMPEGSRSCIGTSGCEWLSTPWSACNALSCGELGIRSRTVTCSTGSDADCALALEGQRLPSEETCSGTKDCGWIAGPWAACNSNCASGRD
jgi:hypothetical protein